MSKGPQKGEGLAPRRRHTPEHEEQPFSNAPKGAAPESAPFSLPPQEEQAFPNAPRKRPRRAPPPACLDNTKSPIARGAGILNAGLMPPRWRVKSNDNVTSLYHWTLDKANRMPSELLLLPGEGRKRVYLVVERSSTTRYTIPSPPSLGQRALISKSPGCPKSNISV